MRITLTEAEAALILDALADFDPESQEAFGLADAEAALCEIEAKIETATARAATSLA